MKTKKRFLSILLSLVLLLGLMPGISLTAYAANTDSELLDAFAFIKDSNAGDKEISVSYGYDTDNYTFTSTYSNGQFSDASPNIYGFGDSNSSSNHRVSIQKSDNKVIITLRWTSFAYRTITIDEGGETVSNTATGSSTTTNKIKFYGVTVSDAVPAHAHSFTYTASGATITAECTANGCGLPEVDGKHIATLTIGAPTTGNDATITVSPEGALTEYTVKYQSKSGGTWGTETETAPSAAGIHKAIVTLGGATALVTYGNNCINYADNLTNGSVTGATGATCGATITPTITPDTGYELDTLTVTPEQGSGVTSVEMTADGTGFVMPEANVTVSGTFKKINREITVTQPATGGTVTADKTAADYGDTITLDNTPATGYSFDSYTVTKTGDSNTLVDVNNGAFTMPGYPVTVTGAFTLIDYTVTVENAVNGTVQASKTTGAHINDEITLTLNPSEGYTLDTVTVKDANQQEVSVSGDKFTMPASDVTVSATFKPIAYSVTVENGTATITDNTPEQNTYTVTLSVTGKTYDGKPIDAATVTQSDNLPAAVTVSGVSYAGRDGTEYTASAEAPTNVGKYTASLTVDGETVSQDFEIEGMEPISFVSSIVYNPATNTITITITTINQYILVTPDTKAWANNYYVVKGDVTINGPVTYGEGVTLILCDDCRLRIIGGLKNSGSDLTIYGQEGQTGVLRVEGADNEPALSGGTINVKGGKLEIIPGANGTLFNDAASVTFDSGVYVQATNSAGETVSPETGKTYTGAELNALRALSSGVKDTSSVKTAPAANTLTYSGKAQELVTAGEATGGTMQYALGTDAKTAPAADAYAADIPSATAAGTCYVWYKVKGDDTHFDSAPASVKVTVAPKQVGLSWANTTFKYDGQSHVPTATATGLASGDNCKVTVTGAQTKAGTYTATATGLDNPNYKLPANAKQSFTIEKAPEAPTEKPTEKPSQKAPSKPVVTEITGASITVKSVKGQQYSIDGGKTWQTATDTSYTFKKLTPGKNYTIVTRKPTKGTYDASPASTGTKVKTLSNAMVLRSGLKIKETTKNNKTTITVKVGKVPGATSYEVYVQYCGKNGFSDKPTATIKNGKTSITLSKINGSAIQSGRSYKLRVIAKKGKTVLCRTPILHAAGSTGSYSDVNTLTLNKSAVTLAKGKTFTIKPKVTLVNSKRKAMGDSHGAAYHYLSSNSSVATVDSSGKITARGAGICVIMVTARNGITKSITVTVK